MIPYPYNMVDMGGIDLAEANGTVVEGLYAKIVEAVNACGDVVLYNWKFAGIEISPQHTSILLGDPIVISGAVQVTEQDLVTVPGINPDPPPPPVLVPLTVAENGQFSPEDYDADGFSEVIVNVPAAEDPLSYTTPDIQMFNSAGEHQLNLDSTYQHAIVAIVARANYSSDSIPIYEETLDVGSLSINRQDLYVYWIDPEDGFSFASENQRVTAWVIYTNRNFNLQVNAIKAVGAGQNTRYVLPDIEGNYFCLIYNSYTNEGASAVFQPSPIAIGSDKAVRYTYAILSSPKSVTYEYTLGLSIQPADNSNYVFLIKEE